MATKPKLREIRTYPRKSSVKRSEVRAVMKAIVAARESSEKTARSRKS